MEAVLKSVWVEHVQLDIALEQIGSLSPKLTSQISCEGYAGQAACAEQGHPHLLAILLAVDPLFAQQIQPTPGCHPQAFLSTELAGHSHGQVGRLPYPESTTLLQTPAQILSLSSSWLMQEGRSPHGYWGLDKL